MRHINLKNTVNSFNLADFEIVPTKLGNSIVYSIKHKNGQYLDHDFVLRETDPDYSGIWLRIEAAEDSLKELVERRRIQKVINQSLI